MTGATSEEVFGMQVRSRPRSLTVPGLAARGTVIAALAAVVLVLPSLVSDSLTYNATQAMAACTAHNRGICKQFGCVDSNNKTTNDVVICDNNGGTTTDCDCWDIARTPLLPPPSPAPGAVGHVNGFCGCPSNSDPAWN